MTIYTFRMEVRQVRAEIIADYAPTLTIAPGTKDCIKIHYIDIGGHDHIHTVVVGERARKTSRAMVEYRCSNQTRCMVFNNAILNRQQTEAVGCSCEDFYYRGLPSKFNKYAGEAAHGCKHMLYINTYHYTA